jgi:hypothetical protein
MPPAPKPKHVKKKKRKKLLPFPSLVKKADKIFSLWIRKRDEVKLQGRCCTCGEPGNQAGHFVKRNHYKVRWNVDNVNLQCSRCNHFLGGNDAEYARFIINIYGIDRFEWLMEQKGPVKLSREDVQRVIDAYS